MTFADSTAFTLHRGRATFGALSTMHSCKSRRFHTARSVLFGLSALLVSAPLLLACGSADVEQPAPAPVDPRIYQPAVRAAIVTKTPFEKGRETLDQVGRALAQGDLKALTPLFDAEADMSFPGMPDASDRDGLLKALGDLLGPFSDRKYAPSRIWQSGEAAVVEWTMTATQSGEWMGVKPTGKQVAIRGVSLFWFSLNGSINDLHLYFDPGAILAQLGAAPKGVEAGPPPQLATTPQVFVAAGSEQEKKDVHVLNASYDALELKNEAGFLAPFADDVEVIRLDRTAPERGKEERRKLAKWISRGLSSLAQNPLNAWGVGPYVIEEYTITGVNSGPIGGVPPSGHSVRLHLVDIVEMRDEKIVREWTYGNSLELAAQMGSVARAAP